MKFIRLSILYLLYSLSVWAQSEHTIAGVCSEGKKKLFAAAKTTVADPAENDYDVKHVKISIAADNQSTHITGAVATTAQVTASSMARYVFELEDQLTVDSVKVNGRLLVAVAVASHVRSVQLPAALPQHTVFTTEVFYHGQPVSGSQFLSTGIRSETAPTWNTPVTYTMSEPYDARDWWPCKQALQDKIDSVDIWITVPGQLKAAANGVLKNITPMPGGFSRYEWKSNLPISYYLVGFGIAPYTDYSYHVQFPNSGDSMLVQNYVYGDNAQTLPFWKKELDSVADMILYFSDLVGRYPFWQEKYGHIMAPLGGGMEHQTMTTQSSFETLLSAHELFHQWFGDWVTCATWKDIWLNEGFASYSEDLFIEKFWGMQQRFQHIKAKHDDVLSNPSGTVYVDDTTDESRIFSGRLTYSKGASVVHSLRFLVNDDVRFFSMLQNYLQQYKYAAATTDQFKNTASQFLQQDLDTFFNQWVYGEGYPQYTASWNQVDDTVLVKLNQTVTSNASVGLFYTPLELKLSSAQGDTVIRIHNSQATQYYRFTWNKPMSGMSIDPDDWLLNYDFGTARDLTLTGNREVLKEQLSISPNPATDNWIIGNVPPRAVLTLYDINGRRLHTETARTNTVVIHAGNYPSGMYQLNIENGKSRSSVTLIRE